jgi:hypothetical protein
MSGRAAKRPATPVAIRTYVPRCRGNIAVARPVALPAGLVPEPGEQGGFHLLIGELIVLPHESHQVGIYLFHYVDAFFLEIVKGGDFVQDFGILGIAQDIRSFGRCKVFHNI